MQKHWAYTVSLKIWQSRTILSCHKKGKILSYNLRYVWNYAESKLSLMEVYTMAPSHCFQDSASRGKNMAFKEKRHLIVLFVQIKKRNIFRKERKMFANTMLNEILCKYSHWIFSYSWLYMFTHPYISISCTYGLYWLLTNWWPQIYDKPLYGRGVWRDLILGVSCCQQLSVVVC